MLAQETGGQCQFGYSNPIPRFMDINNSPVCLTDCTFRNFLHLGFWWRGGLSSETGARLVGEASNDRLHRFEHPCGSPGRRLVDLLQHRAVEDTAFAADLEIAPARPEIDADGRATTWTPDGFDRGEVVMKAYPLPDGVDAGHQFHRGGLWAT